MYILPFGQENALLAIAPRLSLLDLPPSCLSLVAFASRYLVTGAVLPVMQTVFSVARQGHSQGLPRALRTTAGNRLLVGLSLTERDSEEFRLACLH